MIKNAGISGALAQKENPQQISTQSVTVKTTWSEGCKRQTGNIRGLLRGIRRPSEKYIRNMAGKIKCNKDNKMEQILHLNYSTPASFCFLINMLLFSTFISYVDSGLIAGGLTTSPLLTSNLEPCQGH
jgi:hypothetical protein